MASNMQLAKGYLSFVAASSKYAVVGTTVFDLLQCIFAKVILGSMS